MMEGLDLIAEGTTAKTKLALECYYQDYKKQGDLISSKCSRNRKNTDLFIVELFEMNKLYYYGMKIK